MVRDVLGAAPDAVGAQEGVVAAPHVEPYPPSWVDRLQRTIEGWPVAWWLPYVAVYVVGQVVSHLVLWAEGLLPVGAIDPTRAPGYGALYPAAILGTMHYLDRFAARRLDVFRPALGPADADTVDHLRYELTTLPARPTLVLTLLGSIPPAALFLATTPLHAVGSPGFFVSALILFVTVGTGVVFYYHAFHQLRAVERIHTSAKNVDLFQPQPLHAFGQLAARSGIAFIVLAYYAAVVRPDFVLTNPVGIAYLAVAVASGVLSFVVPLYGMHQRLEAEKRGLLTIADWRISEAVSAAWRQLDPASGQEAETTQRRLETVERARSIVERLPTWPWAARTLTGFLSTLLLPVVIWLITNVLGRLLPK